MEKLPHTRLLFSQEEDYLNENEMFILQTLYRAHITHIFLINVYEDRKRLFKNMGISLSKLAPSQDASLKLTPKDLGDLKGIGAQTFQDLKMSRPFLYREQIIKLAGIKYHGTCPLDAGFSKILKMKLIGVASQKEIDEIDFLKCLQRWRKDNAQLIKEMEKNNPLDKREPDYELLRMFLPVPPSSNRVPGPIINGKKKVGDMFKITDAGIKKLEYYNGGINLRFSPLNIPSIEVVRGLLVPLRYFK